MPSAVEIICRAMAKVECKVRQQDWNEAREAWYINHHAPQYEAEAKRLLRDLKGQPPHVADAGDLDAMLEAMTR